MNASAGRAIPVAAPNGIEPRDILNSIRAVLYTWDMVSDQLSWGANVSEIFGAFPPEALATGAAFVELVTAECSLTRYQAIKMSSLKDVGLGAPYRVIYNLRSPSGGDICVEDVGRWFADDRARPVRAHGVVRIIAAENGKTSSAAEVEAFSQRGVCSRPRIVAAINELCASSGARRTPFAVLVAGIEGLTEINIRDGYDAADLVIAAVARRLGENLRGADLLAHYVGGKFALLLTSGETEQIDVAVRRLVRLTTQDLVPTHTRGIPVRLRVGAVMGPKFGRSAHTLLQRAEEAFDRAAGRPEGFAIYAPDTAISEARRDALSITDEIVGALNERRILLAYQPVVPSKPGQSGFFEGLMRLRRDDGSIIGPAALISVAEKSGLIVQIDQRVCELAIARLRAEPEMRISINISVATLQDPDWFDHFSLAIRRYPGVAERLILEIAETVVIANVDALTALLGNIRKLGVKIAMDDFGSGHTSFRNLRSLGVDIVKIDGAFVQNIAHSSEDRFFVRTLADLARHLGIETVAEWVEDAETRRLLEEWGIDYLQGYHLGLAEIPLAPELAKPKAIA